MFKIQIMLKKIKADFSLNKKNLYIKLEKKIASEKVVILFLFENKFMNYPSANNFFHNSH